MSGEIYFCAICGRPVDLKDCNTNGEDQTVRGECLAKKLSQKKPPARRTVMWVLLANTDGRRRLASLGFPNATTRQDGSCRRGIPANAQTRVRLARCSPPKEEKTALRFEPSYSYDAWGNDGGSTDYVGGKNKFRYTGQALDPGTLAYFFRARYFDATVGRFLTRGTLPGMTAAPLTRNRYQYSMANPVRYTDPSGLSPVESGKSLSILTSCGLNCSMSIDSILDAVGSAFNLLATISQEGNAQTSIGAGDVAGGLLQTGSAVVVNPDTVSAVVGTLNSQAGLIQSAAGLLSNHYSKSDLDFAYGEVCSNSYGAGVCLRGQQYVEDLIGKAALAQGLMSSSE
jgi:RHS repeat-associated protein